MKITLNVLKEKGAYNNFLYYFHTLEKQEWDVYELIEQIHKDKKNYSWWLFEEFKLSGVYEEFDENGSIWYKANYKDGKKDGSCEEYKNGNIWRKVNYKDGRWDGPYEAFDEDGKLIHSSIYKDNVEVEVEVKDGVEVKKVGFAVCFMKITLDVLKEKKGPSDILDYNSFLEYFNSLGKQELDVYELIEQIHKDKKNYSRWLFEEFKLSGLCEEFGENGILHRINYKDGKWNGSGEKFWNNGNIMYKYNFKDGKSDGLCVWFYPNKNVWYNINYKNSKKDGPYEAFDEDGKLIHSSIYKDDVKVKVLVQDGMKVE